METTEDPADAEQKTATSSFFDRLVVPVVIGFAGLCVGVSIFERVVG